MIAKLHPMKRFLKLTTIALTVFTIGQTFAQSKGEPLWGTPCKECLEPAGTNQKGSPASVQNGNATIATSYTTTACGLNFTSASVRLHARSFGAVTPATGVAQPATMAISGMPPCFQVLKAFLYIGGSGNGSAFNVNFTNPAATASTVPATIIGSDVDKCWSFPGTYNYRCDVTALISGNGNYVISGVPVNATAKTMDMDGATLFIIYSDPNQTYTGSIMIGDGCMVMKGGNKTANLTGFNVCGPTSLTTNFMAVTDLQKIAATPVHLNSATANFTQPVASQQVYDYIQQPGAPAVAGQTSATYGVQNASDCWNLVFAGMYWRTACNVCTISNLTVTAVTSSSCSAGSATANVAGGTAPYTYTWSPAGGNAQSITNMPTGNYTVVVKDATGCKTGTATVAVNAAAGPTITANAGTICAGSSVNLTANGAATYTWSPGTGLNTTNGPAVTANPAATTVYSISGTNALGCVATITTQVTVNPMPVPVINSNSPVCLNAPLNLTSGGGTTYAWSGPNSFSSTLQNPTVAAATTANAGVYTVTVTSLGCSSTATTNVAVLTPSTTATNTGAYCAGATIQLNGGTATSYSWSGPGGFTSNLQNPTIAASTTAMSGTYNLLVSIGTCTAAASTPVVVNPLPIPNAISNSPVCANDQITFTGSGGTTYAWTGPAFTSSQQNPTIPTSSAANAGTYTLTVTDANSCVNFTTVTVVVNPLPVITVNSPATCLNTSFTLTATGGSTYAWSGPGGFTSNQQNPVLTNAAASMTGVYTVTVTTANNCVSTATTNAQVLPLPNPQINSNSPVCVGNALNLTGTGGATYAWTGPNSFVSGQQNPTISNVTLAEAGVYTLLVSSGSCTASTTATIVINPLPIPVIVVNTPVCVGQALNFTGSGGVTYNWSGPSFINNTQNPSIPVASMFNNGSFVLTVTDANGCTNSTSQNVVVNPLPNVNATGVTVCENGNATLSAGGGVTYSWNGPNGFTSNSQNPVIGNAQLNVSGQYTVLVTDANTCTNTAVATIIVNPNPTAIVSNNTPICVNNNLGLSGSGGVTYNWVGPNGFSSTSQNPNFNASSTAYSGNYILTVTDANGCSGSATTSATINPIPSVAITAVPNRGCAPFCTSFNLSTSPGVQTYNWNLGNGITGNTATQQTCYSTTGIYTVNVTVSDAIGCTNSATYTVEVFPQPVADFNHAPIKPIINIDPEVTFTDASHGDSIVKWQWYFMNTAQYTSTQQNPTFMYSDPGTYAVALVVTSDKGCVDTLVRIVEVGEDFGIYVPNAFTPNADGLNDVFQPKGFGIVKYQLQIFDRWGERVFETKEFEKGWDGKFAGRGGDICEEGSYTWLINAVSVFGKAHELKGHVTLIK